MANVNEERCEDLRDKLERKINRSLGREIGETKKKAGEAKACANDKVEKTTFWRTAGLAVLVVASVIGVCYYLAFSATNGVHENRTEAAGTKAEVRQIKEHLHDFRGEQRAWNATQELKLDKILDRLPDNGDGR